MQRAFWKSHFLAHRGELIEAPSREDFLAAVMKATGVTNVDRFKPVLSIYSEEEAAHINFEKFHHLCQFFGYFFLQQNIDEHLTEVCLSSPPGLSDLFLTGLRTSS